MTRWVGALLAPLFLVAFALVLPGIARAAALTSPADRAFLAWDIQIEFKQQDM